MQRLEGIHRLLLREDAVHANSWLWPGEAVPPTSKSASGASGTGGSSSTKKRATSLTSMLPVVRLRAARPRLLWMTLSRCVYGGYDKASASLRRLAFSHVLHDMRTSVGFRVRRVHRLRVACCAINSVPQLAPNPSGTTPSSTRPPPTLVPRDRLRIARRRKFSKNDLLGVDLWTFQCFPAWMNCRV